MMVVLEQKFLQVFADLHWFQPANKELE